MNPSRGPWLQRCHCLQATASPTHSTKPLWTGATRCWRLPSTMCLVVRLSPWLDSHCNTTHKICFIACIRITLVCDCLGLVQLLQLLVRPRQKTLVPRPSLARVPPVRFPAECPAMIRAVSHRLTTTIDTLPLSFAHACDRCHHHQAQARRSDPQEQSERGGTSVGARSVAQQCLQWMVMPGKVQKSRGVNDCHHRV